MQFRVLGPLEVDAGDGPLALGGPRQRAVLANLLVRANEVVPVETLIDDVWGDRAPGNARNTLQTYVSNLRKTLGDGLLLGRAPGYVLVVDPADVDATRFDALVRDARRTSPVDPGVAVDILDDALAMWRGPALADVAERTLLSEAARLDELRLEAQEERIGALLAAGWPGRAIGELEPLVARHPLRERLWGQLMLALYREGRQADALAAYRRAREILADELGVDPSPALVRLHGEILAHDASLELRGEPLRGYRLLEQLGETEVGIRFRAVQPRVGRDVDVEVYREELASSDVFVERFEREAQAIAAVEHPHVVPVHDYWREPGRAYVVRRYLRGPGLADLLGSTGAGELDTEARVRTVEQIGSALIAIHRLGLTHGRVSPTAVLFDDERHAYLGGFVIGAGSRGTVEHDVRAFYDLAGSLLGVTVEEGDRTEVAAIVRAARAMVRTIGPPPALDDPPRNPYRGLRPFREVDAADFFGRTRDVTAILRRLRDDEPGARFLAVVGPSGCGKSSVVRAGVLPAIRGGALGPGMPLIAEMSPGSAPFPALAQALTSVAVRSISRLEDLLRDEPRGLLEVVGRSTPEDSRVVLVIDQLEEVFTSGSRGEQETFLEAIRVACTDPHGRLVVLATLRADLYDRPLGSARFGGLLGARTHTLTSLSPDELELAITAPAIRAGVRVESGLVAEMIAASAHQAGALPSTQFVLTELFEARVDGRMTLGAYHRLGGISGALATTADAIVVDLDAQGREAARRILLHLIAVEDDGPTIRRRVPRSELDELGPSPTLVEDILEAMAARRILTFDRDPSTRAPTVAIAHDALLAAWPRLRGWLDEAREDLAQERSLARVAEEWRRSDRDPSFLLTGARLGSAEAWARISGVTLSHRDTAFLSASVAERDRRRSEVDRRREQRRRLEQRSARRLRALVAVFAVAALVSGTLAGLAMDAGRRARVEAAVATARGLAGAATGEIGVDDELAILLGIEAVERARSSAPTVLPEAEEALHRVLAGAHLPEPIDDIGWVAAMDEHGRIAGASTVDPGTVVVLDADGREVVAIPAHDGPLTDVAFARDGRVLVTTGEDGHLRAWDLTTGTERWSVRGPGAASHISLDGSRRLVGATWRSNGRSRVLRLATGHEIRRFRGPGADAQLAISPDGTMVAVAGPVIRGHATGRILDLTGGSDGPTFRTPSFVGIDGPLTWSPDGRFLTGGAFVWDATDGELVHTATGQRDDIVASDWSGDGGVLVTASREGTVALWKRAPSGFRLSGSFAAGPLSDVALDPTGSVVITAGGHVDRWDVGRTETAEMGGLPLPTTFQTGVWFTSSGTELAVLLDRIAVRWDLETGDASTIPLMITYGAQLDAAVDRSSIAWIAADRTVSVWGGSSRRAVPVRADLLAWSSDHDLVIADGARVSLVDLDGRNRWSVVAPGTIRTLDVAGDEVVISVAEPHRGVMVVDATDGRTVRWLPGNLTALAVDPTGGRLATSSGGRVELREASSGRLEGSVPAPPGGIDVALTSDRLFVLDADQITHVFDAASGRELMRLPGAPSPTGSGLCQPRSIAISPDGSLLATQGCDGVRLWALDVDLLLRVARDRVNRSLTPGECRLYLGSTCRLQ